MITDKQILANVVEELRWVPDIDDRAITVQVHDGIVTLAGDVPTFNDRFQAEWAAKRVRGVAGVANEIRVSTGANGRSDDAEIARKVVDAVRAELPRVAGGIKVLVSEAHVTLEGNVEWFWQRQRLESVVRAIDGISVVNNLLVVEPRTVPNDIKRRIEAAFVRSAELDAAHVSVDASEGDVTLRGTVSSLREKEEAQRTAWSAPGVRAVHNEITVMR